MNRCNLTRTVNRRKTIQSLLIVLLIGGVLVFNIRNNCNDLSSSGITNPLRAWAAIDQDTVVKGNSTTTVNSSVILSNDLVLSQALFLDNPSLLAEIKQVLNNNSTLENASLKQLLVQANSFLTKKPTSVTEKRQLPPGGDKHDFLSLAPYRWPDPSKPNGLPYIHRGIVNPEIYSIPDKKKLGRYDL